MKKIQAIRGMNDILPQQTPVWQHVEAIVGDTLRAYGYQEIRMPILEQTDLFKRSIGEVTDIVEKEMYSFEDRNGDHLTLRPEGTAGCVRAAEEHGLLFNQTQRLWYAGPMFRHERPQKGRYRQFHQIGVECFGMTGPDIDAELILLTARIWRKLGLLPHLELQINSLGSGADRQRYKADLVAYLTERRDSLDADSQRRLGTNPLRILDSKDPATQAALEGAPSLLDYLDEEARAHFDQLLSILDAAGIAYRVNPRLVRGLDYYGKTVFEWVTTALGAQGTVCAGGRYDGLVEQLGGKPTPGVGFAMGMERLVLLLETLDLIPASVHSQVDAYLVAVGAGAEQKTLIIAERLRDELPGIRLQTHCGGGSFKSQIKKADKSGAQVAIILGEEELASGQVSLKALRRELPQQTLALDALAPALRDLIEG